MIPSEKVKLDQAGIPRLIYFEGNPNPVGGGGDKSGDFLDDMISRNFLTQIDARATQDRDWFGWMKNITPEMMVFGTLIAIAVLSYIAGGFKV